MTDQEWLDYLAEVMVPVKKYIKDEKKWELTHYELSAGIITLLKELLDAGQL